MTINELYKFIQFIANKEQRGFIKPSEFNMLAERAQIDLIHDRVARYKGKDRPSEVLELSHSVLDDIRTVVERKLLVFNNIFIPANAMPDPNPYPPFDPNKNGAFSYPDDYLHFISMHKRGSGVPINIKLLTLDQLAKRKSSVVVPIDGGNMVAVMIDEGFEVYDEPDSDLIETWNSGQLEPFSQRIFLEYIRKPKAPHWGYVMVNDMYVFNPSSPNTVELELPEKTHSELAQRMLSYIGISLRDREPLGYAESKMKDQKQ
tara:strand:+ start:360 stop:1142 length:783 start_codon:yes stop_codon:yes gene_type:complete